MVRLMDLESRSHDTYGKPYRKQTRRYENALLLHRQTVCLLFLPMHLVTDTQEHFTATILQIRTQKVARWRWPGCFGVPGWECLDLIGSGGEN